MGGPASGAARLVRAGVLSALVLGLSVGAHGLTGGALPPRAVLGGLAVLVACGSLVLVGRRIVLPTALVALGAAQVLLHHALGALSVHPQALTSAPGAGHVHGALPTLDAGALSAPVSGGGASVAMVVAHVLATAVSAVVLARADAAVWALWGWLRPLVRLVALPVSIPAGPRRTPRPVFVSAPRRHVLRAGDPRRGPPTRLRPWSVALT